MQGRTKLRRLVAAAAALAVAAAGQAPVDAGWTSSTVAGTFLLDRPSVAVDSADHTTIAYHRGGEGPGIFATTNATGDWVSTRITSARDVRPSLAIDSGDDAHIAFARTTGTTGIYLTSNTTGSWAGPSLIAADLDPRAPSLDVSPTDKLGVAWTSSFSFSPGVYFATNATGSWVVTHIATGVWSTSPWLRYDASGSAHVMWGRIDHDGPGLYHATNATGSWVVTKVVPFEVNGVQFEFDAAGKIRAAFRSWQPGTDATLFYLTDKTGSWNWLSLGSQDVSFGPPAVKIDPDGDVHIVVSSYQASGNPGQGLLFHYVTESDSCCVGADGPYFDDNQRSDDVPAIAFRSDGTLQLAFRRIYPSSGIRFYDVGSFSTLVDSSELVNTGASIDLGPGGTRHIAFDTARGDEASAMYATGTPGAWIVEEAGATLPARYATDIAADGSDKVALVDGAGVFTNATGSWTSPTILPFSAEAEVEVDGSGHIHVLFETDSGPYWFMDYATDASGSWASDSPQNSSFEGVTSASLALDVNGKPHVAWVFYSGAGSALMYQHRKTGAWSTMATVHDGDNAWPSIAVDAAGKVHIAYIHYGRSPGTYYATNKSGTWVRSRLTRSWSDGPPSIALDGSGHVYIATTRKSFAANPGIYVMTNTTGTWVVARVVAADLAGNVSLAVTSTGLARLVYDSDAAVVVYENSSATLGASVTRASRRAPVPALDDAALGVILRGQLELGADGPVGGPGSTVPGASTDATGEGETTSAPINHFGAASGSR